MHRIDNRQKKVVTPKRKYQKDKELFQKGKRNLKSGKGKSIGRKR